MVGGKALSTHFRPRPFAFLLVGLLAALPIPQAPARTINVPAQYTTIQAAIDAATDGDEVVVAPGHYRESLKIYGKGITLRSTDPHNPKIVDATIIDANSDYHVVDITDRNSEHYRLAGLTLTGALDYAISVYNYTARCTIEYNRITRNPGGVFIAVEGGAPWIHHNTIKENGSKSYYKSVLQCGDGIIENNEITSNVAPIIIKFFDILRNNLIAYNGLPHDQPYSTEQEVITSLSGIIANNTIVFNNTMALYACKNATIVNNIIWRNGFPENTANQLADCSYPRYCCIQNWQEGGIGNISQDPRLVDPLAGDFRLRSDSPCIDAGGYAEGVGVDFWGASRPRNAVAETRGDGTEFDMGAHEFAGIPVANRSPKRPINQEPPDGQTVATYTPTLVSSPFADPDPGNDQRASQWQICRDNSFTTLTHDTGVTQAALTRLYVPFRTLQPGMTYWWRVRHQDQSTSWSEWSLPTAFTYPTVKIPSKPVNNAPAHGSLIKSLKPTLVCSNFGGLPPDYKGAVQWQISKAPNFTAPCFDSGPTSAPLEQVHAATQSVAP